MKIPFNRIQDIMSSDSSIGFCLSCGEEQSGVEPDAQGYECESCGEHEVYGASEILLMGEYE